MKGSNVDRIRKLWRDYMDDLRKPQKVILIVVQPLKKWRGKVRATKEKYLFFEALKKLQKKDKH